MFADVRIEDIVPNPDQPRKFFDESAHTELKESIKENGLLQPIVIREVTGESAPHMIVAGERRWRAHKELELTTISARILDSETDTEDAFVKGVAENVGRADMTIMEEAGAYADLVALGWSPEKVAASFGKTKTHIQWRLGLLELRPQVAEYVNEGKIKPNLSWHIAQLNPANQMIVAHRYMRGDFDSEADATNFAQGLKHHENQTSLVATESPTIEEKEQRERSKKKATDKLGRIDEVVMPLLDELTKQKPEELADILGADLGRYVRQIDRLTSQATMARRLLRQANGIAEAREVAWNDAATAVENEQARKEAASTEATGAGSETTGGQVRKAAAGKKQGGKTQTATKRQPKASAAKKSPQGTRGPDSQQKTTADTAQTPRKESAAA